MNVNNAHDADDVAPIENVRPPKMSWKIRGHATNILGPERRGQVILFRFDLNDSSGKIRVIGFNDVAMKFGEIVKENMGYSLSRFELKPSDTKYNNTGHNFEIKLHANSVIEKNESTTYNPKFVDIHSILEVDEASLVNVRGVVVECGDLVEFTSKSGKDLKKRILQIADASATIEVTFFDESSQIDPPAVIEILNCKVSTYNGRSLVANSRNVSIVDPDSEHFEVLKKVAEAGNQNCISQKKNPKEYTLQTLEEVIQQGAPTQGTTKNVQFLATISGILSKEDGHPWYIADPSSGKKLNGAVDPDCIGFSEAAKREVKGVRKWFTQAILSNGGNDINCSIFDEAGRTLTGIGADDYVNKCIEFPTNVESYKFLDGALKGKKGLFKASIKIMDGTMDTMQMQINSIDLNVDYILQGSLVLQGIQGEAAAKRKIDEIEPFFEKSD